MKKQDVPQDEGMYGIHRRACYAQDDSGKYVIVPSKGWEVEKVVNSSAVQDIKDQVAAARKQVESGKASPLAYHMTRCQMTPALLSANSGIFQWRVRRHLKPGPFSRLNDSLLARYADALAMQIDDLKKLP